MRTRLHTLHFAIDEEAYKAKATIECQEIMVTQDRSWPDRNYCSVLNEEHFYSVEQIETLLSRKFPSYMPGNKVWKAIKEDE